MVKKFLASLPRKKYIHIVASLEQVLDLNATSFEDIIGRLKAYEERVADEDEETQGEQDKLMYAPSETRYDQSTQDQNGFNGGRGRGGQSRGRGRGRGRSNGTKDLSKIQCFRCDKFGHYASNCPDRLLKLQETQANDQDDTQVADGLLMNEVIMERAETKCLQLDSSQDKSARWHARLEHIGSDAMRTMMSKELVVGIPRLFDPTSGRIVVSHNVEFNEDSSWEWNASEEEIQGDSGRFKLRLRDGENRGIEGTDEEDEIVESNNNENQSNEETSENDEEADALDQPDAPRRSQRMSDLGILTYYLGIEVCQRERGIALKQEAYAKKILMEAGMGECNSSYIPMDPGLKISKAKQDRSINETEYRRNNGCLRYLLHTRPDLAYSVGVLSRYMQEPKESHGAALKQVLRYIQGTVSYGLVFARSSKIVLVGIKFKEMRELIGIQDVSRVDFKLKGEIISRFSFAAKQGVEESIRRYSTGSSLEKSIAKLQEEVVDDEIAKIQHDFEAAKQSFLRIPDALKSMPKMNPEGIYVNKNVRLDTVEVYGFDYDYTLVHYTANLQSLIYDHAKEHLVNELRYPESCLKFKYDPSFPIRGLCYDKLKGCLLKLDFFGSIEPDGCFYGRRKLDLEEVIKIYGTRHIGRDQARGLVSLLDFFCFSEACLIADVVQHFLDEKLEFDPSYVYHDVNHSIQHVHRSGVAHKTILSDPERYLVKNGQLFRFLNTLRENGKKLFLLTNSPYYFVDGGMRYLLEDSLGTGDSWRELFDVVIAKANKPDFYTSEHPFRCYDAEKDTLGFTKVDAFDPNKIYYHGCLKSFLEITKWHGIEVMYFGDHLLSDLRGPSKAGWRTAAIIYELEHEIRIQNEDSYRFEQYRVVYKKNEATDPCNFLSTQAKFHIIQELLGKLHATVSSKKSEAYKSLMEELNLERRRARCNMKNMFNKYFGATFLTDTGQESALAYHIHRYADVYTSKPENFLFYPPETWLSVPYDIKIMPHHLKVPATLFKT
ncbi:hypothetical protein V2J09_002977 [Rumex salicifolius]